MNSISTSYKLMVLLVLLFLASARGAFGQDLVTCNVGMIDGGFCNDDCDGQTNPDGSCSEGGGSGCPSQTQYAHLVSYSDYLIDSNGTLEAWSTTSNSDGNYGEGTLKASITGSAPDGSGTVSNAAANSFNPSVSVSLSVQNFLQLATDSNRAQFTINNEIDWGCGEVINVLGLPKFGIAYTKSKTDYSDPGTSVISSPDHSVFCSLKSYCQPQQTPPTCNPGFTYQRPVISGASASCAPYYNSAWLIERSDPSYPWDCYPLIPNQNATANNDPTIGQCTKR